MELALKIMNFELSNVYRSKWVLFYFLFFASVSYILFSFENESGKAFISLFNIVIFLVPLVSIIFGAMYFYNSREYIEMILCQPIKRASLYSGLYLGIVIPLSTCLAAGIAFGYILHGFNTESLSSFILLLFEGTILTFIFIAIAYLIASKMTDKVKGFGIAIFTWLILAVVYDGLILLLVFLFSDYPVEKGVIVFSILNPVDLARTIYLVQYNLSALMGYTGAAFQKFFGAFTGTAVSVVSLLIWVLLPFIFGIRAFGKKDF
ncbi:MAG: ABC transporter permease [Ignavibacteriaceae bacterium]